MESVVSGSAGNGIRPSVQTDLKDTGEEKWNQVDSKGSEYRDGGDGLVDLQLCRNKLEAFKQRRKFNLADFIIKSLKLKRAERILNSTEKITQSGQVEVQICRETNSI